MLVLVEPVALYEEPECRGLATEAAAGRTLRLIASDAQTTLGGEAPTATSTSREVAKKLRAAVEVELLEVGERQARN